MIRSMLAGVAALSLTACGIGTKSEGREVGGSTTRNFQVANFNKIEVAGPYDVTVATGKDVAVVATGGANLLDETDVTVEDGTLTIRPKKHRGLRINWSGGKATFTISTAMLNGAAIAGSGNIMVDKVVGDFEGEIAGSGSVAVADIKGGKVKLDIAGAGDLSAAGTAESTEVDIAGSGNVEAANLVANTANVSIAGSGNVKVHATDSAEISIAGSGDVDVTGGGKCTTSKAGSGNVTCH